MSYRVLIADDSGPMRMIVQRNLEASGINEIVQAVDGAEAFKLFTSSVFDLVVTDYNMPNMTGLELTKQIRASGSEVPILMMTTEAERSTVVEAIQAGVSSYLIKPFDADLLRNKLEKIRGMQTA